MHLRRQFLTGSYHNYFRVYDAEGPAEGGGNDVVLQADKAVLRTKKGGTGESASLYDGRATSEAAPRVLMLE
jgi:hypothetical protein